MKVKKSNKIIAAIAIAVAIVTPLAVVLPLAFVHKSKPLVVKEDIRLDRTVHLIFNDYKQKVESIYNISDQETRHKYFDGIWNTFEEKVLNHKGGSSE